MKFRLHSRALWAVRTIARRSWHSKGNGQRRFARSSNRCGPWMQALPTSTSQLSPAAGACSCCGILMRSTCGRQDALLRTCMQVQKKAAAVKKKQGSSSNKDVAVATKALARQEAALKGAQRHLAALQGGGLAEFRKGAASCFVSASILSCLSMDRNVQAKRQFACCTCSRCGQ